MALAVKNLPTSAGDARHADLIPGSGRAPEEGNGTLPQYSCLENTMDRGAWQDTVPGAAESDMTEQLSAHTVWQQPPQIESSGAAALNKFFFRVGLPNYLVTFTHTGFCIWWERAKV